MRIILCVLLITLADCCERPRSPLDICALWDSNLHLACAFCSVLAVFPSWQLNQECVGMPGAEHHWVEVGSGIFHQPFRSPPNPKIGSVLGTVL